MADHDVPTFKAHVQMVTVPFKVQHKGRSVEGLKPSDIQVLEDGIEQQIDSFVQSRASEREKPERRVPISVFMLVDTSNAMYRGYPHAYDAMADFIRGLDPEDPVAVYSFSRNLFRATPLTLDRYAAIAGLSRSVAGDDTALYDSLLLTVRDAAKIQGPKQIVVFSNGADNKSMIGPDDVARIAENEGIPISVVSTAVHDEISANVWLRISGQTGGETYMATNWKQTRDGFQAISDAVRNTYTVTYYSNSSKPGFRTLQVRVKDNSYKVRCRSGYHPDGRWEFASR
jgi:Ca-activated chloride channel homolog